MEHGYHGDTIGTMSTGERGVFNAAYDPLLFGVDKIPFPSPGREQDTLDAFEQFCRAGQVAALLIEPLVLGAGGMRMYPPRLLTQLKRIAETHGCLLIADEVMTGWGRTGTLFACEQASITPDILCVSKGITGGALPLAATLAQPKSSTRICQPIVAAPSFIPARTRPIRSPARRRWQILESGSANRSPRASNRWRACIVKGSRRSAMIVALPMFARSALSSRSTSTFRHRDTCQMLGRNCGHSFAKETFSFARSAM
jgi:hypothetical protein